MGINARLLWLLHTMFMSSDNSKIDMVKAVERLISPTGMGSSYKVGVITRDRSIPFPFDAEKIVEERNERRAKASVTYEPSQILQELMEIDNQEK